ncbi:demethoxyubiquinone hydroxylase family protein [Pseudoalteromonas luteoviolacea]|uniref:demethoxyubiquinone hydroxylase family protein n=1 Tax=Pseudoalteromonas luteoviolacea TaxID=43657 RepID=UPI001B39DEC3|nr:demethoxyubiquinone hydroxylase family protein [Pseudoalteromonas luteoviolacea]MBQ4880644.1 demethoxyubiquinone hydroxylase family protein [Pseudoalteromonas luteoviolacea]MBQ4909682.1 demethoxyubiquinone hydroxylase family protein [Pseudoalteromonas luteoviolacea]
MPSKEVQRIIRVDHAGEFGAINIYRAQRTVAKLLYKDIVEQLDDMLHHEKEHFDTFNSWLEQNSVRHCYALWFWAIGGYFLGLVTALLGRKSIWVCTHAVESTVLHHLDWQLSYLSKHDPSAYEAVLSIKQEEEAHQSLGLLNGSNSLVYSPIRLVVKYSTKFEIWLSTKL